jgi:hypothetical protein
MATEDPCAGLDRLIEIFREFWGSDASLGRLHDAAGLDPVFSQAITERNQRPRAAIGLLIERLYHGTAGPSPEQLDLVDLLFGLTGFAMHRELAAGRPLPAVCNLVKAACAVILAVAIVSPQTP